METNQHLHLKVEAPHIEAVGISDPGLVRSENEDAIIMDESGKYLLLADGMGGHERGAEASHTALRVIEEYLQPEVIKEKLMDITKVEGVPAEVVCLSTLIGEAVDEANSVLFTRNREAQLRRYMGTTVVGLLTVTEGGYMVWFHVGDSRLYRWRNSILECLTSDHSAYAEWVSKGRPGDRPSKNVITRALGPNPGASADIGWERWQENDVYFLCSDGLTDMIEDAEITDILSTEKTVDEIAAKMVDGAKEAGGRDNTTVIVCMV